MVDPEEMEERGVDVADMDAPLHRCKSEIVGRAVHAARLEAATGKPHRERVDVMVAAGALPFLPHRRPPKLPSPDNDRVVEKPTPGQIENEPGTGPIDLPTHLRKMLFEILTRAAVVIPVGVPQLHVAHPPLDESAGEEAVAGKG